MKPSHPLQARQAAHGAAREGVERALGPRVTTEPGCGAKPHARIMSARIIDGTAIGHAIREELRPEVEAFTRRAGRPPGLGIVLVGDDPASEIYVRSKLRAGAEAGLWVDLQRLPATAGVEDVLALVDRLNASPRHDGILVQDPLPAAMGPARRSRCSTPSTGARTSTASTPPASAGSSRTVPRSRPARRAA